MDYFNFNETLNLPKFDQSLGTLDSVKVIIRGELYGSIQYEHTGNSIGGEIGNRQGKNLSVLADTLTMPMRMLHLT